MKTYLISNEDMALLRKKRSNRIMKYMQQQNLDFLILSNKSNLRYACDIETNIAWEVWQTFCCLLSRDGGVTLFNTDGPMDSFFYELEEDSHFNPAKEGSVFRADPKVRNVGNENNPYAFPGTIARLTAEAIREKGGAGKIGIDMVADFGAFKMLESELPGVEFVGVGFDLGELRMRKFAEEVQLMEEACRIEDRIMMQAVGEVGQGSTDFQLGARVRELLSWEPAVEGINFVVTYNLAGTGTAGMTWKQVGRKYGPGETVTMDFSFSVTGGMNPDYSRTRMLGKPSRKLEQTFLWLHENYQNVVRSFRPGARVSEIYEAFRESHATRGVPLNGLLGHGNGTDVSEFPHLTHRKLIYKDHALREGMLVNIEPSTFVDTDNGPQMIHVEDPWLMEKDGFRRLSKAPYFHIDCEAIGDIG